MPKMKTRSLAKKRFTRTAKGKIKGAKAFRRHLLSRKTTKVKRGMRHSLYVSKADTVVFNVLLPYSS